MLAELMAQTQLESPPAPVTQQTPTLQYEPRLAGLRLALAEMAVDPEVVGYHDRCRRLPMYPSPLQTIRMALPDALRPPSYGPGDLLYSD